MSDDMFNVMPSATEIDDMRIFANQTLPDLGTIKRPGSVTSDGMGGSVETADTTVATGVQCSLRPTSTRESEMVAHLTQTDTWAIDFVADTDVQLKDSVTVNSIEYEVISVMGGQTWEIYRQVIVVRST
jgi:hypothetical protein